MGRQDDSPEHQMLSGRGGRAPDAVKTHRAKRSVPGWRQDSGWKQRQIRTQRRIDVASLFAIDVLCVRCVRRIGRTGRKLVFLLMMQKNAKEKEYLRTGTRTTKINSWYTGKVIREPTSLGRLLRTMIMP